MKLGYKCVPLSIALIGGKLQQDGEKGNARAEPRSEGRFTEPWLVLLQMRWQAPAVRSGYLGAYAFGRLVPAAELP